MPRGGDATASRQARARRRGWGTIASAMRSLIVLAWLLLLASSALAQPLFSPAQGPLAGARVFDAKGCIKCHAIGGTGGKVGPDLARTPRPRTFYDLAAALWNHAPTMAARMRGLGIVRPHLDPADAGDLAGYLFTLSYFDRRADVPPGRRLFPEKGCAPCHRLGGAGGTVGPALDGLIPVASPISVAAAM